MCHLHYKLAKRIPGVTEPPTSEAIAKAMNEFDVDQSGGLSYDEFLAFSKKWFSRRGFVFLRKLVVSAVMTMVALPESANLIQREVPAARIIPKRIFKVVFGISKLPASNTCVNLCFQMRAISI